MMNLFVEVGRLCRETDAFLAEKTATNSPLLQVRVFERGQEWSAELAALQQQLNRRYEDLLAELKSLDDDWDAVRAQVPTPEPAGNPKVTPSTAALKRLEELYRLFSYLVRWRAQLQERLVRISL